MMYTQSKKYFDKLKHPLWQKKRLEVLNRDNFTCLSCLSTNHELHVHHLKYPQGEPWDIDNEYLLTLCKHCHRLSEDVLDRMIPLECHWDKNREHAVFYDSDSFGVYHMPSRTTWRIDCIDTDVARKLFEINLYKNWH